MSPTRALLLSLFFTALAFTQQADIPTPLTDAEKAELFSLQLKREQARSAFFEAREAMQKAVDEFEAANKDAETVANRIRVQHKAEGFILDRSTLQWVKSEPPAGAPEESANADGSESVGRTGP